jgi:erythromycin esterase
MNSGPTNNRQAEAFIKWASENAVSIKTVEPGAPFDDLRPLTELIGDARVVCLGESRHDAHEHFRFKHRLLEFLVEEMDFTLFAMEESMPCAERINEYVLRGTGDPEALLDGMGAWFIWDTEEVLALVKWMRNHNQNPATKKKVRFHGIDISGPKKGLVNVLGYLEKVDPEGAALFRGEPDVLALFSDVMWPQTVENYGRLSPEDLNALASRYAGLLARFEGRRTEYVSRSSPEEYEWLRRQALVTSQANDMFTTFHRGTFAQAGDIRERAMADNIRWILKRAGEGERLVVWAHNFHVTRCAADLYMPQRPPVKGATSAVAYLSEELGDDLVSIGFSFERRDTPAGPLPQAGAETVDGVLARVGLPCFILDLRSAPKGWAGQKLRMRGEGDVDLVPADAFDALFFVDRITKTVPTRGARRRFESLRN